MTKTIINFDDLQGFIDNNVNILLNYKGNQLETLTAVLSINTAINHSKYNLRPAFADIIKTVVNDLEEWKNEKNKWNYKYDLSSLNAYATSYPENINTTFYIE